MLHQCLDAGFQTFHLSSLDDLKLIGELHDDTPTYIETNWAIPLQKLPSKITPTTIRQLLLDDILPLTKKNELDTLILPYFPDIDDNYHLDILDTLTEMQRQGYLRSIATTREFPERLLQRAVKCGFSLDAIQQESHLFQPVSTKKQAESMRTKHRMAQWWSNPLADDLLTERYMEGLKPIGGSKKIKSHEPNM